MFFAANSSVAMRWWGGFNARHIEGPKQDLCPPAETPPPVIKGGRPAPERQNSSSQRRERIGAHQTVVEREQGIHTGGRRIVAGLEMALHGGDGVAHQAKGHMPVGRALVFDKRINITVARRWFFSGSHKMSAKGRRSSSEQNARTRDAAYADPHAF